MPAVAGLNYGADVAPPPPAGVADVFAITAAPHGGMTSIQEARAEHHNGYTYIGFVNGSTGAIEVAALENASPPAGTPKVVKTGFTADAHNAPALLVEATTHKLWVAYCDHNGSDMFLRISVNSLDTDPTLSGGFTAEVGLASQTLGFDDFTYPILLQLTGETNDPVYLFWREVHSNGRLAMSKSTDVGATWSARVLVYSGLGSDIPYWNIGSNGVDRWDVFATDGAGAAGGEVILHFYCTGGDLFASDGTEIFAGPITGASAALHPPDCTLVLDDTNGACVRAKGLSWDGTAPAGLIWQRNGASDNRLVSARWRSGAWQIDTVIESIGGYLSGNSMQPGASMHPTDPDVVLASKKVGSVFEAFLCTTPDDGATWDLEQITGPSSVDNFLAAMVRNGAAACEGVWLAGDYTSDTDSSLGVMGYAA